MQDNTEILNSIMKTYEDGAKGSTVLADIAGKVESGTATYAEVFESATERGKILTGSLEKHLPAALDGQANIAKETADELIKKPMIRSTKDIAGTASRVQKKMNEDAGLGIGFIEPEPNEDQIDGIITGLVNAETYAEASGTFLDRVVNCLQGFVDDCVHDNADFQSRAGLSPKIERIPVRGCCEWCARLGGTYDYDKVSNKGNDVFRRHRNCGCMVLYNPGDSKNRQNVHTKARVGRLEYTSERIDMRVLGHRGR